MHTPECFALTRAALNVFQCNDTFLRLFPGTIQGLLEVLGVLDEQRAMNVISGFGVAYFDDDEDGLLSSLTSI